MPAAALELYRVENKGTPTEKKIVSDNIVISLANSTMSEYKIKLGVFVSPTADTAEIIPIEQDKSRSKILIKGSNCPEQDCWVIYEPKVGLQPLFQKVKESDIESKGTDQNGIEIQEITVILENPPKEGGKISLSSSSFLKSSPLGDAALVCNMLADADIENSESGFSTASLKKRSVCKRNKI